MKKLLRLALLVSCITLVFTLVSMGVHDTGMEATVPLSPPASRSAAIYNKRTIDSAISLLQSGYVVLRMGLGADSRILAQINRRAQAYSHCGIVMIEHGYPFVYHSIGGEDNPDARLRRDSAVFFFSPLHNASLAIIRYDYSASQVAALSQVVTAFYRARPRFDMKFDLATDDQLYCSEFVYKAILRATADTAYLHTTTALGRRFVGIDDLYLNPHASYVWQATLR